VLVDDQTQEIAMRMLREVRDLVDFATTFQVSGSRNRKYVL